MPDARMNPTLSQALPVSGTSDFMAIRARGQLYVDKTGYVERMLASPLDYVFLARPRRFGKSLLLSTLECMYARESDDWFQDLAIGRSGFLNRIPQCPVLKLDVSLASPFNAENIDARLRRVVDVRCQQLDLARPTPDMTAGDALWDAVFQLRRSRDQRVVVLVDEYDAPITNAIGADPPFSPSDKDRIMESLRGFYGTLKSLGQEGWLEFTFITGISRFEGAGLFSALNNLVDISLKPAYGAICGFTEAETAVFAPFIAYAAEAYRTEAEVLRDDLRRYYNGYQFTRRHEWVYNPISYLHALQQLLDPEEGPEILHGRFPRPWIQAGIPYFLFRYMRTHGFNQRDVKKDAAESVWHKFDLHNPGLTPLLFQTGFLTFKPDGKGGLRLDYPNLEVEETFREGLFLTYLGKTFENLNEIKGLLRSMQAALLDGNYREACACFNLMLDNVPFDLLQDEAAYQGKLHMTLYALPAFLGVESEVHTRTGKLDTVVETPHAIVIFELKMNSTAAHAMRQLQNKAYGDKYAQSGKSVIGIGLNFNAPKNPPARTKRSAAFHAWGMDFCIIHTPRGEDAVNIVEAEPPLV